MAPPCRRSGWDVWECRECMALPIGLLTQEESLDTVDAALDAGVTLLDTGDFYGMEHNELLLHEALAGRHDQGQMAMLDSGKS